ERGERYRPALARSSRVVGARGPGHGAQCCLDDLPVLERQETGDVVAARGARNVEVLTREGLTEAALVRVRFGHVREPARDLRELVDVVPRREPEEDLLPGAG